MVPKESPAFQLFKAFIIFPQDHRTPEKLPVYQNNPPFFNIFLGAVWTSALFGPDVYQRGFFLIKQLSPAFYTFISYLTSLFDALFVLQSSFVVKRSFQRAFLRGVQFSASRHVVVLLNLSSSTLQFLGSKNMYSALRYVNYILCK